MTLGFTTVARQTRFGETASFPTDYVLASVVQATQIPHQAYSRRSSAGDTSSDQSIGIGGIVGIAIALIILFGGLAYCTFFHLRTMPKQVKRDLRAHRKAQAAHGAGPAAHWPGSNHNQVPFDPNMMGQSGLNQGGQSFGGGAGAQFPANLGGGQGGFGQSEGSQSPWLQMPENLGGGQGGFEGNMQPGFSGDMGRGRSSRNHRGSSRSSRGRSRSRGSSGQHMNHLNNPHEAFGVGGQGQNQMPFPAQFHH